MPSIVEYEGRNTPRVFLYFTRAILTVLFSCDWTQTQTFPTYHTFSCTQAYLRPALWQRSYDNYPQRQSMIFGTAPPLVRRPLHICVRDRITNALPNDRAPRASYSSDQPLHHANQYLLSRHTKLNARNVKGQRLSARYAARRALTAGGDAVVRLPRIDVEDTSICFRPFWVPNTHRQVRLKAIAQSGMMKLHRLFEQGRYP